MSIGISGAADFNSIYSPKMMKNNENVTTGSDVSNAKLSAEKK